MTRKYAIKTGLEVFLADSRAQFAGKRVGLITNPTGIDHQLHSTIDLLLHSQYVRLCALFGPEHGIRGDAQDGIAVENTLDARTGLPVYSLYGSAQRPSAEMLRNIDALIFDIQDVGTRYYTYTATMVYALEAAARAGIPFIIFDRPNPLTGLCIEGNLLDPAFTSLVGIHPIPVRHGLTLGELGKLIAAECGYAAPLVVPMDGWQRSWWFDETDVPWVLPSPNLPTLDTAVLYPGMCLLEGTNLSEGRGTTRPFELFGAPWIDPYALVSALEKRALPGVAFRPLYFTPVTSKYAGQLCGGVQIHIFNRDVLRPVALGLHILHTVRTLYQHEFVWIQNKAESYPLDRLYGSDQLRKALDAGATVEEITANWYEIANSFAARRQKFLLYPE